MKRIPFLICTAGLVGCAVAPDNQPTRTGLETSKHWTGTGAQSLTRAEATRDWWNQFGDSTLRSLITEVRRGNLDVRAAEARVKRSRALVSVSSSALYPVPSAAASWTRTQSGDNLNQGFPEEDFSTAVTASWELDIFGRVRKQVQAADAEARADVFNREDVLSLVSAEVGRRYIELRGNQAGLEVAEANVSTFRDIVALNESLLAAGQISQVQLDQARANLRLAEASVPTFQAQAEVAADRIALLLGKTPGYRRAELLRPGKLPNMPGIVAGGVPSDLLLRRPDVRAAAERVAAATAGIGVAEADFFPRFSFNGSVRLESTSFADLFTSGAAGSSFGPSLTWNGLDYWRVRAQVLEARARNEELMAGFEKTVLAAAQEVSEQSILWTREKQRASALASAVEVSREAASVARTRYERGLEDFITVLQAELTRISAEAQLVQSETNARLALVGLYRSLGGGWRH